jgi:hypothetical protein
MHSRRLRNSHENRLERTHHYHQQGAIKKDVSDVPTAPSFNKKALVINKTALPASHLSFAATYNNIGLTINIEQKVLLVALVPDHSHTISVMRSIELIKKGL